MKAVGEWHSDGRFQWRCCNTSMDVRQSIWSIHVWPAVHDPDLNISLTSLLSARIKDTEGDLAISDFFGYDQVQLRSKNLSHTPKTCLWGMSCSTPHSHTFPSKATIPQHHLPRRSREEEKFNHRPSSLLTLASAVGARSSGHPSTASLTSSKNV